MSVLRIRTHKRYAICRKVHIEGENISRREALLFELSLQGCRVSNAGEGFAMNGIVVIGIDGAGKLSGRVRWHHNGTVGCKLLEPLSIAELERLIRICRDQCDPHLWEAKRATA